MSASGRERLFWAGLFLLVAPVHWSPVRLVLRLAGVRLPHERTLSFPLLCLVFLLDVLSWLLLPVWAALLLHTFYL